jgi:hypothetical protein
MAEPDEGSTGKQVADGLKAIFERIADFFDLFDLSFLVSGISMMGALFFGGWRFGVTLPDLPAAWMTVLGLLVGCYVLGLVCFATGRWVRTWFPWAKTKELFCKHIEQSLKTHNIASLPQIAEYLNEPNDRTLWRLYVKLWAELRQSPDAAPSLSLLKRYWVMAATYDGVAVALFTWAATLFACAFCGAAVMPLAKEVATSVAFCLLLASFLCSREAGRYMIYQVEELAASIAVKCQTEKLK